jgi:hypothetical protein
MTKWLFTWSKHYSEYVCFALHQCVWLIFLQLTVVGMKHADERVALQAVEFWTTVCEEEVELAAEANEVCAK